MYCSFAPYQDPADDVLASMAQLSIFFSLVASIVTSAYPDDPVMSALLPLFLVVPIVMMVLYEIEVLDQIKALTQPDDDGNILRIGRAILYVRDVATRMLEKSTAQTVSHDASLRRSSIARTLCELSKTSHPALERTDVVQVERDEAVHVELTEVVQKAPEGDGSGTKLHEVHFVQV